MPQFGPAALGRSPAVRDYSRRMLGGMTDSDTAPDVGQLVRVRGQQWVVNRRSVSTQPRDELAAELPGRTLVTLTSVSDDDLGDELTVAWEIEPGREVLPATRLPAVSESGWDDPQTLGAFLDAVRWGTVASADDHTLQAPFRAGITIEDYQLEPVAKALGMPRVNLLIADDVGLGKTIEAGLVVQEMLLRNRARRVLVVCPAPLIGKWRDELAEKFGLEFTILDAPALKALRRTHGLEANPFSVFPRTIVSLPWLRTPRVQRLLDEVLVLEARHPGFFDILVVDEAHHCAPPAPAGGKRYALDSLQTQAVRRVGDFSQHRLFLSATPHNGYPESWQALLEMLDPQRFARGVEPDPVVVQQVMVRRLKDELTLPDGSARFPGRHARAIEVTYTDDERAGHDLLTRYTHSRQTAPGAAAVRAGDLISLLLKKRLFSSPAAFARTLSEWLTDALAWEDEPDAEEAEADVLERAGTATGSLSDTQAAILAQLDAWAARRAEPADSKADALVTELIRLCRPGVRPGSSCSPSTGTRRCGSPTSWPPVGWAVSVSGCCTGGWTPPTVSTSRMRSRLHPTGIPSGFCWRPMPPARASICNATVIRSSITTSRSTPTGWSSASAGSTATAKTPRSTLPTSWAPGGSPLRLGPTTRTSSSCPAWPARSPRNAVTSAV